jgi:hypothetical protein
MLPILGQQEKKNTYSLQLKETTPLVQPKKSIGHNK